MCLFDCFSTAIAFLVLKELQFAAPLAFAPYHQRLPASVAPLTAYKGLPVAVGANGRQRSATPRTHHVAALNGLQAGRAMVAERRAAAAFGAVVRVTLHHFPAMDTGLFVCRHSSSSLI
jgi:hypothetical protein